MTATPASRPRPVRRPLDDLGLPVDATILERLAETEPSWLTADRAAAFEAYRALPPEANLLYTPYIDLRSAQLADVVVVEAMPETATDASLPAGVDGLIEIREGRTVSVALSPAASAAGVRLVPLDPAIDPELVQVDALPSRDKFARLTRALWRTGIVVDIPSGVHLEQPIVVRWALGEAGRALVARTIVRLGAGTSASLVEELVASDGSGGAGATGQAFFSGTTEVALGTGASLRMASLQELPEHVVVFQHRVAEVGDDASLHWALAQLGGRLVRSRVDNRLVGDRSSVEQVEIVFGGGEQLFDLTSYTTHIGRDTTGNLLSKGALLDRARTYMKGLITIERSAIGTDSFLGEFGMNLSKSARSVAIPSLEIDQPDCRRAAHSSSVGPIDEQQLFYLGSRGIPPDEARKFVVLGFLEPVVARVPLASAQARLRELLEAKWSSGAGGVTEAAA